MILVNHKPPEQLQCSLVQIVQMVFCDRFRFSLLFLAGGRFLGAGEEGADGTGTNQTEAGGGSEDVHGFSEGLAEPEGRP